MSASRVTVIHDRRDDGLELCEEVRREMPGIECQAVRSLPGFETSLADEPAVLVLERTLSWSDAHGIARRIRDRWPAAAIISFGSSAVPVRDSAGALDADEHVVSSRGNWTLVVEAVRAVLRRAADGWVRPDENEARWRLLFEHAPVGILRIDDSGCVLEANAMAATLFGSARPEALVGFRLQALCPGEDPPSSWIEQVGLGCSVTGLETTVRCLDGSDRWVRLSARPTESEWGAGGCEVLMEDITERRAELRRVEEIERQLHHAQKMEAVGRLAGGVAHDFNNLLTVILGHASLVQEGLKTGDVDPDDMQPLIQAARRAADLTRQLLSVSHSQPGRARVIDPGLVIGETIAMLSRLIGEDIDLVADVSSTGQIQADPGQLQQVLMNLAVNARDAMPTGGRLLIRMRDRVLAPEEARLLSGARPGPHVCLEVRDDGEGIAAEIRDRIFDPFFTTKEPGIGTGLGLAIVHGIVKRWDGALRVESEPGRGTTFEVFFPVVGVHEESPGVLPRRRSTGGPETLLVTEDDDNLRQLVTRALKQSGYRVLESRDGQDALEMARRHDGPIDLLLTDVVMPAITGPDLATMLQAGRPELRVVLMSGYAGDVLRRRVTVPPDVTLLEKPFTLEMLRQVVRATLDGNGIG